MDKKQIAGAVGAGVVAVGLGLAGGFALDNPETIVKEVTVEKLVPVEKIVEVEVVKEVPVNVTEIVEVEDEEFLKLMCDRAMFDDIQECREEVAAEDEALKLALELLDDENEVFDFLEDESLIEDEDEARIVKVYDDFDEIEILDSDFDDEEYLFKIQVRIEDEETDEKFKVWFEVAVEEGEAELKDVYLVDKETSNSE